MTDDYVSLETARLLKEAGFIVFCDKYFVKPEITDYYKGRGINANWNALDEYFSRPTLSLAAKWLREKFNVHFEIFVNNIDGWSYVAYNICEKTWDFTDVHRDSYEDALDSGITRFLKMICKNEKENSKQH